MVLGIGDHVLNEIWSIGAEGKRLSLRRQDRAENQVGLLGAVGHRALPDILSNCHDIGLTGCFSANILWHNCLSSVVLCNLIGRHSLARDLPANRHAVRFLL